MSQAPKSPIMDRDSPLNSMERMMERTTLTHVAVLIFLAAWAFGGNADWAKILIGCWATFGLPILLLNIRTTLSTRQCLPRVLHTLWPFVGFNLLISISLLFPGFWRGSYEGEILYVNKHVSPLLPSSARPGLSLFALWVFDGIYLSCFNLFLAIKSRRSFRLLLMALSINALVLAIFGTLQKLVHAEGLFFGLQASPQTKFFASFIYHNHWGAFTVLMLTAGLGVFFHYLRRHTLRELSQTPAMLVAASVLLLSLSVPLSGSRSTSVITFMLLVIALINWISVTRQRSGRHTKPRHGLAIAAALALVLVVITSYYLGEPVIRERLKETKQQLAHAEESTGLGQRGILYRDTWRMASDRLLFGWGMGSYPNVFVLYNSQDRGTGDNLPHFYHDAHSDWLQSVAEVGLVGTTLLALCGLMPLWHFRSSLGRSPISNYLLLGCGLILLYAWLEFPFGNTAVVIAFWICFFTALPYGRIEAARSA